MKFWLASFLIRRYPPGLLLWTLGLHARQRGSVDQELFIYLFLVNSGLDRCDLKDRKAVARQLERRLRRASAETAVAYVGQFSALVHLRGSAWVSLALIECFLGIEGSDYPDPERPSTGALAVKLEGRLREVEPALACQFVMGLVNVCSHVDSRGAYAANAVVETFLGLTSDDYTRAGLTAKLGPRLAHLEDVGRLMLLGGLAVALLSTGRKTEAQALYCWYFELESADLLDGSRLAERVRTRAAGFRPEAFALMVHMVPVVLHPILGRDVVIRLVEDLYEITPDLYASPQRLAERLGLGADAEGPLATALALNEALQYSRRFQHSRAVLSAIATDEGGSPRDTPELLERLPRVIGRLKPHQKPPVFKLVMDNLFRSGELAAGSRFLEGLLGLAADDYAAGEARVAAKIRSAGLGFSAEDDAILIGQLFGVLIDTEGREQDAVLLLDAYLWEVLDLSGLSVSRPAAVELVCHLVGSWLEWNPSDRTFPRCGKIVKFLRDCLDLRGVRLEDRSRFVRTLATVRRRVVQIGREQAGKGAGLWLDVLCWDVELGQRLLLERYRFLDGEDPPWSGVRNRGDAVAMRRGWSLNRPRPIRGGLYGEDGNNGDPSPRPYCFGYVGESPEGRDESSETGEFRPSARFLEAQQRLSRGVTPEVIAAAIGPNTVLVRAGFLAGGQLYWDAFRSDGVGVTRIAGGVGEDRSARDVIDGAVALHDRFLTALWAELGGAERPLRDFAHRAEMPVREIARRLGARRGAPPADPAVLGRLSTQVVEACSRIGGEPWLVGWLNEAIPANWADALVGGREPLRRAWEETESTLAAIGNGSLEQALDRVTERFLDRVASHLDLHELEGHLDAETDVIVEVEGPLHAVPIALLRVGGSRLFERVRSVRTSLSLLIDVLRSEHPARPAKTDEPDRLLTVSWFREGDPAAAGAAWLHHGQEVLAERFGLTWESASDQPPGGPELIREALLRGPAVRLLSVCGHGTLHGPGVQLQGELWSGQGCDFDKVDWLLLVSCSLGRVRHAESVDDEGEPPDVEGFIAHLVARRVRSVLACRWPVHGANASRFANVVVGEYLASDGTRDGPARRAGALNRARMKTLGGGRTNGLNTVAAFEVYGGG